MERKLEKSQESAENQFKRKNLESEQGIQNEIGKEVQEIFLLEKDKHIEKLKQEIKELKKDKNELNDKLKFLNSHIEDLKYNLKTLKSSQNRELLRLQDNYEDVHIKYEATKKALKETEELAEYHEEIARKLKEFILNSY